MRLSRYSTFEQALHQSLQDISSDTTPNEEELQQRYDDIEAQLIECNLKRNYKEAQRLSLELDKIDELRKERKHEAIERLHANEIRSIKIYFDKQCKSVVEKYSTKIEKFAWKMDKHINDIKIRHENEAIKLKESLSNSFPKIALNKRLIELRTLEFNMANERRFIEAENIKNEIKNIEKELILIANQNKMDNDIKILSDLKIQHKNEIDNIIKKLITQKEQLYVELKNELNGLENWKKQQYKRLKIMHHKDINEAKTLMDRHQRKSMFTKVKNKLKTNINDPKSKSMIFTGDFRSSIIVPWVNETINEMKERQKTLTRVSFKPKQKNEFIQYDVNGNLQPRKVIVGIDTNNTDGLWWKSKKNSIKFTMNIDNINDIKYPCKIDNFNEQKGVHIIGSTQDLYFVGKNKDVVRSFVMELASKTSDPSLTKKFFEV